MGVHILLSYEQDEVVLLHLVAILAGLAAANGQDSGNEILTEIDDCECGEPVVESNRIFGGVQALPGEIPWQVLLSMWCGGTLVSDRHIITAANCVEGLTARDVSVLVGETNRRMFLNKTIQVKEIIIHEAFEFQKNKKIEN